MRLVINVAETFTTPDAFFTLRRCGQLLETDEDGDAQVDVRDLDEVIFLGVAAK